MRTKRWIFATGGLIAAVMCAPAVAQEVTPKTDTAAAAADDVEAIVIVKGIRKSLQSSADKKRRSAQISDTITAEDAGKLPDNNVAEALSRVTGVQITRERGEGGSVAIRGQTDIQTTINGQTSNSGTNRAMGLNDIPADLLKSVTVYKTRTADQVEGGIAGTVNVELRRPLDLPKGWTFAGSVRNVMSDVGDTNSPYASALVANRWAAGDGEMGFLLNASYQKNNYGEQYVESETPRPFWDAQYNSLSPELKALNGGRGPISVYRTRYGVERGYVERPALDAAFQWRVNEHLDFVLEGSSFKADEHRQMDVLDVRLKDSNAVLSNVVMMPDGNTMKSATFTGTDLPVGVWGNDTVSALNNKRVNFEGHWHDERWTINASISSEDSRQNSQWYRQSLRFNTLTSFFVDMNSDQTIQGAPYVILNGVDLADVTQYTMREIENGKDFRNSKETVWQADATYRFSDDKFFRTFQVGVRHSDRQVASAYGYRYAGFRDAKTVLMTNFPGGDVYDTVSVEVPGFDSPVWHRMNLDNMLAHFDDIRAYANDTTKRSYAGGSDGVPDWANPIVTTERSLGSFESTEKTSAIYGQFTYGFDLLFPVDGTIGVRATHTEGASTTQARPGADPVIAPVDYTDTLPNVNAIIHFTPKVQLRLAYTENVQRPGFNDATSWASLDTSPTGCHCGWGGNPELKPNHETSYDASLEYYFGRGGVLSFATYLKQPDGFITWIHDTGPDGHSGVPVPGYDGLYVIDHPLNAGPGTFQGYEASAQGFFDFLPGRWKNLGASANITFNQVAKIKYCYDYPDCTADGDFNALGNSRITYNLALYYDTPKFSGRIAYNYRERYRDGLDQELNQYSLYVEPTSRLDAAFNYTPVKYLTLSLEATNLLHNNTKRWWGEQQLLPMGIRVQARTVQLSARFRY